ncbi:MULTISPECIES: hypothetical protein [unclassified Mesorhizobium]|uniref:HIT domain-containing protein n=1 Tax=unclassified Mesorhizobium TaxID=325217 RepID=UPI000BAEF16B|nr:MULTISPECIES: hypothetical protein [unclassified Mesorhizobium]PBC23171.1 hypothetical protein CK226_08335 [Mesorhizobium sp. WSM4311]TRD06528.1 hypothetical protein FJV82_07150 [Mesorhizobium sp. WSM4305]
MQLDHHKVGDRFSSLLSTGRNQRAIYDQIIFETQECVVCPTLGSILPNWLLVIPRRRAINFAHWQAETGQRVADVVSAIADEFGLYDERVVWFEHGPAENGSSIGCGVDWAHLHILVDAPFSAPEMVARSAEMQSLNWTSFDASKLYEMVDRNKSYLMAGGDDASHLVQDVEHVGSQFLRRVVADLVGLRGEWNYRTSENLANVQATLKRFPAKNFVA